MSRIAEDIKTTLLEFVADLKTGIFTNPTEQGDLLLVEFAFKTMGIMHIADHIVTHVLPHKAKIHRRDVDFFIEKKKEIFAGLPTDRIEYFAELVRKPSKQGGLQKEDKEVIWSYFDTLLVLAEDYKKKK